MLRQTDHEEPTNQYLYKPDHADASELEVEDYLDHFSAPLVGRVSYQQRTKMRNDLRHQLEQVIVAYQELGSTRAEAVAETLQQFSQSAHVSQIAVEQTNPVRMETIPYVGKSGLGLALQCFGLCALFEMIVLSILVYAISPNSTDISLLLCLFGLVPPTLTGIFVGHKNSNRILRSLLKAHLLLIIPTAVLTIIPAFAKHGHTLEVIFAMTGMWFASSVTFGSVGAVIGKWLKKTNIMDKLDPPTPVRYPQDRML